MLRTALALTGIAAVLMGVPAQATTADWSRVKNGLQLNLNAHPRIDTAADAFLRNREFRTGIAARAAPYLPLITQALERRGLPTELALLPYVESRYNPGARSRKAAVGLWQFIPQTAREMGLQVDGRQDERLDVVASTLAALDYLELLYARLGTWELAMAAYNCGPSRVEAAQARNHDLGKPTDFWSLDLPRETEQYVPQILAAARLVTGGRAEERAPPRLQRDLGSDRRRRANMHVVGQEPEITALEGDVDLLPKPTALPPREILETDWDAIITSQRQAQWFRNEQRRRIREGLPLLSAGEIKVLEIAESNSADKIIRHGRLASVGLE